MGFIETRIEIAASPERVFDAARDIDLHVQSQQASGERAVAGVTSGLIGLGEEVTFEARHFGLRLRHRARITALERPRRFVDEMVDCLSNLCTENELGKSECCGDGDPSAR